MAPIPNKIQKKDNSVERLQMELHRQQQINEELEETINKNKRKMQEALDELEGEIPETPVQSDWNENNSSSLAYIKNKPTIPGVPTNVSAFTNDVGYITSSGSCAYADSAGSVPWSGVSGRPSNVSAFTNDAGYITNSALSGYATQTWVGNNYLPLSGGTMTGAITAKANQYEGSYGINMNNSDIIGLNSIYTADLSDSWNEGILFKRTNSNWDSFRAADGHFYINNNSGSDGAVLHVSRLILSCTNDSSGTSDGSPALIIGGSASTSHVEIDGNEIMAKSNASTTTTLYLNAEGGNCVINETSGNCGIGVSSPSYKLHVAGTIYCTGGFTFLSDIRKKNVITYQWSPTLDMIADAPIIRYTMKDDETHRMRVGSVAQYWQKVMPETVTETDDTLSMDGTTIALTSVIALARVVKQLKAQIDGLTKHIYG